MKTGVEHITEKRLKQTTKHGFDAEHDKQHTPMQFLNAAKAYMYGDRYSWPFDRESFKVSIDNIENWSNAGAMIAAAIDLFKSGKYTIGKQYEVNLQGQSGTYEVVKIGHTGKVTDTRTITIKCLTGSIVPPDPEKNPTFMIGSEFDLNSKII